VLTFLAKHEPRYVEQAWQLVLQHPADLGHLSKQRLPAVLVDIDDEELCFVGERETRELMEPLWRHGRIRGGSFRSLQWLQPAE
jgi:hypothetical protein